MKIFFSSRIFLLILIAILIFVVFAFGRAYYKDYSIRQEIKSLEETKKELEKNKLESIELLKYVSSDEYVEDQARLELNMLDNGEKVVFLENNVDVKEKESSFEEENNVKQNMIANYKKWWYYITKHNLP